MNSDLESCGGFRPGRRRASLGHAPRHLPHRHRRRPLPSGGNRGRPQQPSEACLAGRDRAVDGGRYRHGRDMRRTGKSKTCVWRWQERFAQEGVDGLLRDKTRPSRVKPLRQEVIDKVVALTATEPPHEATHWTAAAMAEAVRISLSSVQRICKAPRPSAAPHTLLQTWDLRYAHRARRASNFLRLM